MALLEAQNIFLGFLSLFSYAIFKLYRVGRRDASLPPGPPTVPLFGNALQIPTNYLHMQLTSWAREYGDIYSLKALNSTIVVLSSTAAVADVLDRRGGTTGDRPVSFVADESTERSYVALSPMKSDIWRLGRKSMHAFLNVQAVENHVPMQIAEATQLLNDVFTSPSKLFHHVERSGASVVLSLLYGKRTPIMEGSEAEAFFTMIEIFSEVNAPGRYPPLDVLTFLQHIPERFAPWLRDARGVNKLRRELFFDRLLKETEANLRAGKAKGCYIEDLLNNQTSLGITREQIGHFGAVLADGGAATSSAMLKSLILCMIAYPECQRKAQEEIDSVVGSKRLPELEDLPNLPYVQAIIKETHRFRTVFPYAIPHSASADEMYGGYLIPKGATLFMNTWAIFHDPEAFDDPDNFKPERYLATEHGTKPGVDASLYRDSFIFGAGRRICPGSHMATNFTNLITMNLLWAFTFENDGSFKGSSVDLDNWHPAGFDFSPKPFTCKITPRGEDRSQHIRAAYGKSGLV